MRPVFETMEERILHSADLAPLLVTDAAAGFALQQTVQSSANDPQSRTSEIVFVDLTVPDADTLLADLRAQRDNGRALQIVTIAADQDGLAVISGALATRHDISAVHVVAHGSDGVLQLGMARLDAQSLMARAAEVAGWGAAMTADADLLLYGCDFAQTDIGRQMVGDLAALTGTDVAASSDPTGAATLGGNWVLEQRSGSIEAASATSAPLQQAWGGLLGNDFRVNSTTNNKQTTDALNRGSQQAVAYDGSGNFVVVWTSDNQDGDNKGVYARRFGALGNALTGEIQVAQTTDKEQRYARVASDSAGNFVVTWSSKDQDGDKEGVYMRRFGAAGNALTNEIRVNTTTSGEQVNSVIGMNASTGDFVIAWEGNGTGDSAGVFFRRFAANGSALDASEKRGNQTSSGTEQNAAVAMDTAGRFVIAFDVGNHTYFQRFDAAGTAQGSRTQVDNVLGSNGGAAIAMDGAGNFTIVYREDNISPGVWGRGFNADGSQRYTFFHVDSGNADSPSIAMAGDGSFVVGYQKTGTNGNDIFTRLYTAGGSPVAAGAIANQYTSNEQTDPSVAQFGDTNHYVVVWSGKSSSDSDGVSARVFASALAPVATASGGTLGYVENDGPRAVDAGIVVTDADSPSLVSATIRIAVNFSVGQDVLAFTNQNGITGSWNAGTGVLVLSGSASVANYQIALRSVTYTNTSEAPSTVNRTVSFVVNDGQADSVAANRTISVTARNDAPTGASKTVTLLEDTPHVFTVADFGYTDPLDVPANVLLNVRITTLPLTGSLKLNGVAVATNQFVSANDIGLGRLVFTPIANASGAPYAGFNFQLQDNGGTANGGVDLDLVSRTITLNVTPVNDAPLGANKTVTVLEDASHTFAATDFGFSDPNDTAPNALINVRITSLPVAGSLTLSGSAVTVDQFISVANISAGNLRFAPVANASGAAYASFGFRVQDGGGTANGGADLDTISRTMRVDVTSVNDAPGGSNVSVATTEDAPYVFSAGDFGFSDTRDAPSDTLLSVKITTLPINGNLQLNGVAVFAGQFVSATDIGSGRLAFVPVANANGSNYASFTFQVRDNGGTVNGGVDLDPTPRTARIDVTSVNDAPVGTSKTVLLAEDTGFVFSVADFGFTDPNDSPANTLTDIRIVSLPLLGNLTLSGAAVTSNQLIAVASINAGNLRYTPLPNANGNAYASFTFTVRDNGGISNGGVSEDVTLRTMTLNVTAVNDAPVGTVPAAQDMVSNTTLVFSSANANAIVISDVDAGGAVVHLTLSVGTGDLTLNGVNGLTLDAGTTGTNDASMGFSGTLADINAALNGLQFFPGAVFTGSTTLSIVINDQGNSGSGGAKSHSSSVVINVSFVNSAPVLTGSENLQAIFEDAANNAGTLVATLIGGSHVTDSNPGALSGIAVVDVDNSNGGDWQYSGDGGVSWNSFGSPTSGIARLLAADGQTFVRFVPDANWIGTVSNGLTFRAWDATSGTAGDTADTSTNGGTSAFSTATASASVTVLSVNDAPSGVDQTVSMLEHTAYTFARTDFGFSDPIDSPANTLLGVRISSLPSAGALTLNGVAVAALDFVTVADLDGGKLVFTPTAHGNGAGFASFGFQVRDDGGTANGGIDTDPTVRTMTLDVTSVNDAPSGSDATVTTSEDTPYVFSLGDFGFSDTFDTPPDTLLNVKIASLPINGTLQLNGLSVTAGLFVSAAAIGNGELAFVPVSNANGSNYASFTFQAQDSGGTTNFGVDLDPSPHTLTIHVTSVNDAPTGSDTTLTIQEDNGRTFSRADFGFSDSRDLPAHLMRAVRIDALPVSGSLTLDGQLVAAGQFISVADIDAMQMVFTPAANANGLGYASLTFRVQDDGGTASGGADLDLIARTITFNVTAVNDAPLAVGSASLADVAEDTLAPAGASVGALYLGNFSDAADAAAPAGNALAGVAVRSLTLDAGQGLWQYSIDAGGSWSEVGAVSDAAALSLGLNDRLRFVPAPGFSGTPHALSVRLIDDSVAVASGALIDVTTNGGATAISAGVVATTTQVLSVNDAPMGQDRTVSMREDATHIFSLAEFGFSDANDVPANAFLGVHITGVPLQGTLTLAGVAVVSNQFVAANLIDTGQLVFRPATDANGAAYATLGFRVQDDGGTANGGVDLDATARTLTLAVTSVNDAPTGASLTVTLPEDGAYVFRTADFGYQDSNDSPGNALAFVTIMSLPGQGVLTLEGVAVAPSQTISGAEIAAGKLRYAPPANANGSALAGFSFQIQDDGGTANGGVDLDPSTYTLTLTVSAINDAPTITAPASWLVVEDTPGALTGIVFADPDAGSSTVTASFSASSGTLFAGPAAGVTSVTNAGALVLTGVVADINAMIANGQLQFVTAADATDSVTLRIDINDGGNSGAGGAFGASALATLNVQAVQDAPRLARQPDNQSVTVGLAARLQLPAASFADPDAGDTLVYRAVQANGLALPGWLRFDPQTLTFSAAPGAADVGVLHVQVLATDSAGASAQAVFSVVVVAPLAGPDPVVVIAPRAEPETVAIDVESATANTLAKPSATQPKEASDAEAAPVEAVSDTPAPSVPLEVLALDAGGNESAPTGSTLVFQIDTSALARVQRPFSLVDVSVTPVVPPPLLAPALVSQLGDITLSSSSQGFGQQVDLMRKLEELRRQMSQESNAQQTQIASAIALSSGLSIGYVIWLIRGGVLLSSMLSALPAWQMLDPLPVLTSNNSRRKPGATAAEDPEVEQLFDGSRRTPSTPAASAATDAQGAEKASLKGDKTPQDTTTP